MSYRNLASEDRAQLERILKRCRVVRSDEEAARSGTVHYFQGYAVDHAGAASAREASEMSCPRYEVLVNEGRPLADGDGGGGGGGAGGGGNGRGGRRRGGGGFQGRFFDDEAAEPVPGVLSPDGARAAGDWAAAAAAVPVQDAGAGVPARLHWAAGRRRRRARAAHLLGRGAAARRQWQRRRRRAAAPPTCCRPTSPG